MSVDYGVRVNISFLVTFGASREGAASYAKGLGDQIVENISNADKYGTIIGRYYVQDITTKEKVEREKKPEGDGA